MIEEYQEILLTTLTSILAVVYAVLYLKLRICLQRNAQLTKDLASAGFRLDLAQESVSMLESELERKTFQIPAKSAQPVRKAEEKKIPAHHGEAEEFQNYLEDAGAMIIQEDQVSHWMKCEAKLSVLQESLAELQTLLNSSGRLPKQEIVKTATFLVQKMSEA